MLITSIFSFSHNVLKKFLSKGREYTESFVNPLPDNKF